MLTDIQLTTPALLFSTVSLIMLAYTNRFLAITKLVRDLYSEYGKTKDEKLSLQINMLRHRAHLIKLMQLPCIMALLLSVLSMLLIVCTLPNAAVWAFCGGLLLLTISLGLAIYEVAISTNPLNFSLKELEEG